MKRSNALPCCCVAFLGLVGLVFASLPDPAGSATPRAPTIAPKRIAELPIEEPDPAQVALVNAPISQPLIPSVISAKFLKFFPLVSASIEVFESAASGGHRAKLDSLGDLSAVPAFAAPSGSPPFASDGGSEVDGSISDASGHRWTVDETASSYDLDKDRFRYGQIDFEGRCTRIKPYTLIVGYTQYTTDCEEIEVSFYSGTEPIPSHASIAIWRDYGQSTEAQSVVGPVPVKGVTASKRDQYLSLSQALSAPN